jgi:hypothetical protein
VLSTDLLGESVQFARRRAGDSSRRDFDRHRRLLKLVLGQ